MADVNESGNAAGTDELTLEDKAYFESGGKEPEANPSPAIEDEGDLDLAPEADDQVVEAPQENAAQQKTVPHKALHAEREEHKRTKSDLQEARERLARLEERTNMVLQQMQAKNQPEPEPEYIPDPTVDPVGALAYMQQQLMAMQQSQSQATQEMQKLQEQERQNRAIINEADTYLSRAIEADPVVQEAFMFASEGIRKEIAAMGHTGPEAQQIYNNALVQFAQNAPKTVEGVAERAKAIARYYGWTPSAPQQQGQDKISQLQKAVTANRSLSQAAGKTGGMSAADIDSMSDSEFSEWLAKGGDAAWRRLNGV